MFFININYINNEYNLDYIKETTEMNILKIAKECGLYIEPDEIGEYSKQLNSPIKLKAFANAVIEEYKNSLVPVKGVVIRDNSVTLLMNSHILDSDTPLYALKETSK